MYSITYTYTLENLNNYELHVEPPLSAVDFFASADDVRYRRYQIEYNGSDHEIICPEYIFPDKTIIILVWFLIPGRHYPLPAYLYACSLYSSNPDIGQREASEATRKKFGLETFSHSTLSRTFTDLEQSLEKRFGKKFELPSEIVQSYDDNAANGASVKADKSQPTKRSLPTVEDTAKRRKKMQSFLREFYTDIEKDDIASAGCYIVKRTYKKTRQLLI
jgi:hypothetical protein